MWHLGTLWGAGGNGDTALYGDMVTCGDMGLYGDMVTYGDMVLYGDTWGMETLGWWGRLGEMGTW